MLLSKIKISLRISSDAFDNEIQDLIDAAKSDLMLSGVDQSKCNVADPLIIRAITVYCKVHFGYDNKDADRFNQSYEMLKQHLTLSSEYTTPGGDENVE